MRHPFRARREAFDALVLDARLRQSLAAIRSLGRHGLGVAALESIDDVPTFSSRWCAHADICPVREGGFAYLAHLERWLDHSNTRVVIPSFDGTVALLRRHRERIESRTLLALCPERAVGIAVNKELTLDAARRLGIDVPHGIVVESAAT